MRKEDEDLFFIKRKDVYKNRERRKKKKRRNGLTLEFFMYLKTLI